MNTNRVHIIIGGELATVPREHVEKFQKKEMLVTRAAELSKIVKSLENATGSAAMLRDTASLELRDIMGKIIRLNRRTPRCVEFVAGYPSLRGAAA